jgi:hypothetical protein
MFDLFLSSFGETLLMVAISGVVGALLGVPLGVLLHLTNRGGVLSHPLFNRTIGVVVNAVRSIPFIILLVVVIPFTRFIVGSSIGTTAAVVPLTIAAIPFIARLVEPRCARSTRGWWRPRSRWAPPRPDRLEGAAARGHARHRGRSDHHVRQPGWLFGHGRRDRRRRSG